MKSLIICFLFGASAFAAIQANPGSIPPDPLHARAFAILQAEHARAKQPLCPKAANTLENNLCYRRELDTTDANYQKLVRALGAMIRVSTDTKTPPARIPFDDAEAEWVRYRDVACTAFASQFNGGTIQTASELGCEITVLRHHMDELWALYADVGSR